MAERKPEYYKVSVDIYQLGERLDADLYFRYQRDYIIFKNKGTGWSREDAEKISNSQIDALYMQFESAQKHHQFLHAKLSALLDKKDVPLARKAQLLQEVSEPIFTTVFVTPKSAEAIGSAVDYVKDCLKFLNAQQGLPELFKLSAGSLTEHTHALHVATYSVALAKKLGHRDPSQTFAIGMGGLLHDIGKSTMDPEILNKDGPLSEQEWKVMRQHPEFGDQILDRRQMVPLLSRRIVLEHHERINGKGYPYGIRNIHLFSKIVAICDVFASMVVDRKYAKAKKPFDVLAEMLQIKDEFDQTLIIKLIELLGD